MMKAWTMSSFFIVLAVLAMACVEPTPLPPHAVIYISEPNLQTAIRQALDKTRGEDITAGELAGITALYACPKIAYNPYCYVEMDSSDCYDVSPSQGKVVGQRITDISILADLTSLTNLTALRVNGKVVIGSKHSINEWRLGE